MKKEAKPRTNSDKQYPKPSMVDVLNELKRSIFIDLNCVQIGIIQSFDVATQSATIKLALKRVIAVDPNGIKTLQERPLILECPVMFLFGGASFISLPIQPGDECIVLFNDREISNWYVNGGVQTPTIWRTHDVSDAFAIVGIKNLQTAIGSYLANGIRISRNSNTHIDLTDDLITAVADLFLHTGDVHIEGDLTIDGDTYGDGAGNWKLHANVIQAPGNSIHAGNGATGNFNTVNVVDGIVVGGS